MASSEGWRKLRESGFRILFTGLFSMILAFIIYSNLTAPLAGQGQSSPLPAESNQLTNMAYTILAITAISLASMTYGLLRIFKSEQERTAGTGSLLSFITGAFLDKRYWKVMVISSIGYAIFFGFLSQIFVYNEGLELSKDNYVQAFPSTRLTPCCGAPGYMPMFSVYLADDFLILVIPLNVSLAAVVSMMVGFNVALAAHAYGMRKKVVLEGKTSFVGGIGAASGLFAGCPTCAGTFFSVFLGFGAGTSLASLAAFQTLFILLSIPALAATPFLIARQMRAMSRCAMA